MTPAGIAARSFDWRLPQIETWPRVVAFAQSRPGKLVLFALFAALMKLHARDLPLAGGLWLWLTVAAAAVSVAGRYRYLVLLACTGMFLARDPGWFNYGPMRLVIDQQGLYGAIDRWYLRAGTLVGCAVLALVVLHLVRRFRDHPLARRPVLAQHVLFLSLLGLAVSNLLHGLSQVLLWSAVVVFSAYFWYLAWALIDQRHRSPPPVLMSLATFNAFSWSALVPMGKGAANWRSVEAAGAEELAVTQLKGLKLLAWALVLGALLWAYGTVVYGKLGVPRLGAAFDAFAAGRRVPPPFGVLSIVANFFQQLLVMAIWGHVFVALARLAGFRLLRNTWRPLSARTIAEFWNRYYYYFKELLVAVYFYPAYVRWFRGHPRLRLAFATFMAAGVGNFFFHLIMTKLQIVVLYGLGEALSRMQSYAFYCVLLSAGIVVSQLRARRPDAGAGWLKRRLVPFLVVTGFFCFVSFFDGPYGDAPLSRHFAFLFHVLGIDRLTGAIGR